MEKLSFLITKQGFLVDKAVEVTGAEARQWRSDYDENPYGTLYQLAFQECPACFDAAGLFLCQLAERFAEELFVLPGLELSRENTELAPGEESAELLLSSVPFVLGAEYVTKNWLKRQYKKLLEVFRAEIRDYPAKCRCISRRRVRSYRYRSGSFFILWKTGTTQNSRLRFSQPTPRPGKTGGCAMSHYNTR